MSQALRSSPDLVLLDVGMPNTSGWEAFELIYRLQPSVPVIAITSRVDRHEDALRARTGALLEKPFELADLLKVIRDVLEKSDLHRAQRDRKPDGPASVRCG
jgi:DNA-binding response OmpR family regulator